MKKIFSLLALLALGLSACQKQPSEAERQAEIERQVQDRLAAERQADAQTKLTQRQAELDAREAALAAQENQTPAETATPAASATPASASADDEPASETGSYATFYRKLDPYGDWMETGDYGYVFQPRQATQVRDWRPYTNGHWVYTDAGWTWISEEKFGWATYHYGRWIRLRSVGWVWVPGEQWAPAWVSWRRGDDFVGWAPLPPEAQFDRQTGIHHWADNYYDIGPDQYAFVPANEFGRKLTSREIVPTSRNVTIINQTTNVTNIVYSNSVVVDRGPSYDDLRSRSRQPIERFRLERTRNLNDERPVFRGEVVALPTVDFHPAERNSRPNRVTKNIARPVVERGWTGIKDQQAAEKARSKMKAEATPPPHLPPKRFVRPEPRPRGNPPQSSPTASPSATPVSTPRPPRPSATPTATATATPTPRQRPSRPGGKQRPTATATPSASASATPNETLNQRAKRKPSPPAQETPATTPPAPAAEPTPPQPVENIPAQKVDRVTRPQDRAGQEERRKQRQEGRAQRRGPQATDGADASPAETATPADAKTTSSPAADASSTPAETAQERMRRMRKEARQQRKERQQEGRSKGDANASPTPGRPQP